VWSPAFATAGADFERIAAIMPESAINPAPKNLQRMERTIAMFRIFEFTIEATSCTCCKTRNGKSTGTAAVGIAVEMVGGGGRLITRERGGAASSLATLDQLPAAGFSTGRNGRAWS